MLSRAHASRAKWRWEGMKNYVARSMMTSGNVEATAGTPHKFVFSQGQDVDFCV
jgi:predicted RNA-binding protein with PUA-like domain